MAQPPNFLTPERIRRENLREFRARSPQVLLARRAPASGINFHGNVGSQECETQAEEAPPDNRIRQTGSQTRCNFPTLEQGQITMGKLSSIVKPKTNACLFGDIVDRYAEDDDDRAAVLSPDVTAVAIWRFVTQEWEPVSQTTVKEHRAKNCACFRIAA